MQDYGSVHQLIWPPAELFPLGGQQKGDGEYSAMIKTIVPAVLTGLVAVATAMAQPSPWKGVDELFERRNELSVGPLQVRLLQLEDLNWELGVRLNGRKLHSVGNLNVPERADFGLFPLLRDSNPQLIVHAETGGSTPYAICWIYTTDPQPRLVYSSEWYWRDHPCHRWRRNR
jgi:hypothetical protein